MTPMVSSMLEPSLDTAPTLLDVIFTEGDSNVSIIQLDELHGLSGHSIIQFQMDKWIVLPNETRLSTDSEQKLERVATLDWVPTTKLEEGASNVYISNAVACITKHPYHGRGLLESIKFQTVFPRR